MTSICHSTVVVFLGIDDPTKLFIYASSSCTGGNMSEMLILQMTFIKKELLVAMGKKALSYIYINIYKLMYDAYVCMWLSSDTYATL